MRHSKPLIIAVDATPLADQAKTGVGYYTQQLLESLAATTDIRVIAYSFGHINDKIDRPNIRYIESGKALRFIYYGLRKAGIRLPFEWLIRQPADIQLFPNFIRWPSLRGTPQIVVIHDLSFLDCPEFVQPKNLKFLKRYVGRDIRRVRHIIAVSDFTKQRIEANYRLKPDKISVIPIAAPLLNGPDKTSAKHILHLGSLEPRKNYAGLVKGYLKLSPQLRRQYPLVLAGKAFNPSDRLLDGHLEEEGVLVKGYVDEKDRLKLLAEAAAVCSASFYEGFGMPILEAFKFDKPLLLSDIPVYHEVAGNTALYFDPHDEDSIARTLEGFLEGHRGPELTRNIPARLKHYDVKDIAASLNELLAKVSL